MKTINLLMLIVIGSVLASTMVSALITNNGDGTHTLSYTADTAALAELRDALCHNYRWQEYVEDENFEMVLNEESCIDFADRQIKDFLKNNVKEYRHDLAKETARLNTNALTEPSIN